MSLDESSGWSSYWDLAAPSQSAAILRDWYGRNAPAAAALNAKCARDDDRDEDYEYWMAVLRHLSLE